MSKLIESFLSTINIFRTDKSSPLSLFCRKSCQEAQDSLKIIFNWHLSDEPELPWSQLSTNQIIRNKRLFYVLSHYEKGFWGGFISWLTGFVIHIVYTMITFMEYQRYQFLHIIIWFTYCVLYDDMFRGSSRLLVLLLEVLISQ